jgi:predicted nucleic acid-binding Zn ribbon protein
MLPHLSILDNQGGFYMSSTIIYKECPKCNAQHNLSGSFCSRKCANSRTWSEADRQKKSVGATRFHKNNPGAQKGFPSSRKGIPNIGNPHICHVSWCKICNKLIKAKRVVCSKECNSLNHSLMMKKQLRKGRAFTKAGWYVSPFAGRVYLESSWEFKVAEDLDKHNISWTRPKYIRYMLDDVKKMYYPDFYLVDYDCYLDPKNSYVRILDQQKLKAVVEQNNIKLILLDKDELSWDIIKSLIV